MSLDPHHEPISPNSFVFFCSPPSLSKIKKPFALNELRGAVQTAIANREHSQLFKEMLIERVASDVIRDKISQRLDVLGKYLQELAQVQRRDSISGFPLLGSESGDALDLTSSTA